MNFSSMRVMDVAVTTLCFKVFAKAIFFVCYFYLKTGNPRCTASGREQQSALCCCVHYSTECLLCTGLLYSYQQFTLEIKTEKSVATMGRCSTVHFRSFSVCGFHFCTNVALGCIVLPFGGSKVFIKQILFYSLYFNVYITVEKRKIIGYYLENEGILYEMLFNTQRF